MSKKSKQITSSKKKNKNNAISLDNNSINPKAIVENSSQDSLQTLESEESVSRSADKTRSYLGTLNAEFYHSVCLPLLQEFAATHTPDVWFPLAEAVYRTQAPSAWSAKALEIRNKCRYIAKQLLDIHSTGEPYKKKLKTANFISCSTYWLQQFVIMLLHHSEHLQAILQGSNLDEERCTAICLERTELLQTLKIISNPSLEPIHTEDKKSELSRDSLYAFCQSYCVPWQGFSPNAVLCCNQTPFAENVPPLEYDWAIAEVNYVCAFYDEFKNYLENWLFIDLIAAQHTSIYHELCKGVETKVCLPAGLLHQLQQRIKFDGAYQNSLRSIYSHEESLLPPHRRSRLTQGMLKCISDVHYLLKKAVDYNQNIYIFNI